MAENWKPIEGYEGVYEVSDHGRVRNIKRGGRFMTASKVSHGYLAFNLSKNGKTHSILAHRLVATTFIPNPENKSQVNHKDMDKSHNTVENLEWVTPQENLDHATKHKPWSTRKNPWRDKLPKEKQSRADNLCRSNLMSIRVKKGLTREQLAEASCVRLDTIERLETGEKSFRETNINVVCKLAYVLDVSIPSLFEYDVKKAIEREQAWHRKTKEQKQAKED